MTTTLTIPAGNTSASLPANNSIAVGSVAGTITVTLTSLTEIINGQQQPFILPTPNPSAPITVPSLPPVITSVKIIDVTPTGFTVDIVASSTSRDLSGGSFTFMPASGATLSGMTGCTAHAANVTCAITGSDNILATQASSWFAGSGLASGGAFDLQVPFTFQGSTSAIGSVLVTLTNSVNPSVPVSGTM